ncbi:hypothetical protein FGB62_58g141 [Gracilaria domingensis]|nr:hypothetical protein FGB62_58g141 [Gracilaria domingensis]
MAVAAVAVQRGEEAELRIRPPRHQRDEAILVLLGDADRLPAGARAEADIQAHRGVVRLTAELDDASLGAAQVLVAPGLEMGRKQVVQPPEGRRPRLFWRERVPGGGGRLGRDGLGRRRQRRRRRRRRGGRRRRGMERRQRGAGRQGASPRGTHACPRARVARQRERGGRGGGGGGRTRGGRGGPATRGQHERGRGEGRGEEAGGGGGGERRRRATAAAQERGAGGRRRSQWCGTRARGGNG